MKTLISALIFLSVLFFIVPAISSKADATGPCITGLYSYNSSDGVKYLSRYPNCATQADLDNHGVDPNPLDINIPPIWPNVPLINPPSGTSGSRHGCNTNLTDGGFCWTRSDTNDPGDPNRDSCSYNIYVYVCDEKQTSCLNYSCDPGSAGCMRTLSDQSSTNSQTPLVNPDGSGNNRANDGNFIGGCSAPTGTDNDHYIQSLMSEQAARVGIDKTIEMVITGIEWYKECVRPGHPLTHWASDVCKGTYDVGGGGGTPGSINNKGAFMDSVVWYTGETGGSSICSSYGISGVPLSADGRYHLSPGVTYTANVTMNNNGSNRWHSINIDPSTPYQLKSQHKPTLGTGDYFGVDAANLPSDYISSGSNASFDINFTVPVSFSGAKTFDWRMDHVGVTRFGNTCSIPIYVELPPTPTPTATPTPIPANLGTLNINYDSGSGAVAKGTYGISGKRADQSGSNYYNAITIKQNITGSSTNYDLAGVAFTGSGVNAPAQNSTLATLKTNVSANNGFILIYANKYINDPSGPSTDACGYNFCYGKYYVYFGQNTNNYKWNAYNAGGGLLNSKVEIYPKDSNPVTFTVYFKEDIGSHKWGTFGYLKDATGTKSKSLTPVP